MPAYPDGLRDLRRQVSKPVFGWEGAGLEISAGGAPVQLQMPGHTAGQAQVRQEFVDLPSFTDTHARFVPHLIDGPRPTPRRSPAGCRTADPRCPRVVDRRPSTGVFSSHDE